MENYEDLNIEELIRAISLINPIKEKKKFKRVKDIYKRKFEEEYEVKPV